MDFGKEFGDQVKLFPQKNLFCNPMIKGIPEIKPMKENRDYFKPSMKLEDSEESSFMIQSNPLNSEVALKSRRDLIRKS